MSAVMNKSAIPILGPLVVPQSKYILCLLCAASSFVPRREQVDHLVLGHVERPQDEFDRQIRSIRLTNSLLLN